MPYNIYDNRGNKIGQVTSPAEQAVGTALFIVLLIYAFPFILAIGLAILAFQGLTQIYWPWATTAHSLTPYANLNGVITCLVIPLIAFLISARWEKVARGEVSVFAEFGRIAAIVYCAIAILSVIPTITSKPSEDIAIKAREVYKWFWIAPIAASTLTYLRFRPIRVIVGLLIGIPLTILGIVIVVLIAWAIINAIGSWLFR